MNGSAAAVRLQQCWRLHMPDVEPIAPVRIGGTDIVYAQGMRAGPWLFFTGHEATDFENGIAAPVAGIPGLPLGGAPRYLREGRFIFDRLAKLITAEGGDLRHIVRVDQYYPRAECVNPYQRARKTLLKEYVPPSTSVLMDELLVEGANMNVSLLAVLPGDGREPRAARPEGVPVPQHSGFIASLVSGDYVFVAGQMPNNEAMDALDQKAYRAPNALWNGTDIRLQAEFLVTRLKSGLEAGGSSLKNAVKAQVYLTNIGDLPEFLDVWNGHFADNPCALTVVQTKGLGLTESIIEINIFGVRDQGKTKKQIVEHKPSSAMRLGPAAIVAGDLVCLSALYAADESGALPTVQKSAGLRHLGVPAQHQMRAILGAADEICRAAGSSLGNVVRAHHFVGNLDAIYPALRIWQDKLGGAPIPFGAVRTALPIPGCDIVMDMWSYRAGA
jgi:enamine deaminase RidA (YjgF/YER057c/UK114 family)